MNTGELSTLIQSFTGGTDSRTRHWANRKFIMTEGVYAVANKAGAHWLMDIIATEVAPLCLKRWADNRQHVHFFHIHVTEGRAKLFLNEDSGEPDLWRRDIEFTTFPEGEWTFYLAMDGVIEAPAEVLVMLLPSEN